MQFNLSLQLMILHACLCFRHIYKVEEKYIPPILNLGYYFSDANFNLFYDIFQPLFPLNPYFLRCKLYGAAD